MDGRGTIDVSVSGEGRGIVVTVADHGPGIPAELRGRVFEPYVTTKPGGTGLGLALVRQTVGAHEGTIAVSETGGGGATFTLVFPA
jgi:signal transduction histidine kinase